MTDSNRTASIVMLIGELSNVLDAARGVCGDMEKILHGGASDEDLFATAFNVARIELSLKQAFNGINHFDELIDKKITLPLLVPLEIGKEPPLAFCARFRDELDSIQNDLDSLYQTLRSAVLARPDSNFTDDDLDRLASGE